MIRYISIFLILLSTTILPQDYNFLTFGSKEGLKDLNVYTVCQTPIGLLYVGTPNGLAAFDGTQFRTFTTEDGLPSNNIISIKYLGRDSLFVGTNLGLTKMSHGRIISIPTKDINKDYYVANAKKIDDKALFFSSVGVLQLVNDTLIQAPGFDFFSGMKVYDVERKDSVSYYVATEKGLYIQNGNAVYNTITSDKVYNILLTDDILYLATVNGLYVKSGNKITHHTENNGLPSNFIYKGILDNKGDVWLATDLGAVKYSHGSFKVFNRDNGLISDQVFAVYQDNKNNYFFGTNHGLVLYKNDGVMKYSRAEGIKSNVWKIVPDSENSLMIGTEGNGALALKDNLAKEIDLSPFHPSTVWDILIDKSNATWFATDIGVFKKTGNRTERVKLFDRDVGINIYSIYQDSHENLWFSSFQDGLFKFDGNKVINFNRKNGLNHNTVYIVREDWDGIIWVGSERGLNRIENDNIVNFPGDSALHKFNVLSILFDSNGGIILGTYQKGILFFKPSYKDNNYSLSIVGEKDGLNSNSIMFMERDKNYNLWVGTLKGLNKFDLLSYYSSHIKRIISYNQWDGFLGIEANQNSSFIDSKNYLWYGTITGMVRVDLNKLKPRENFYGIHLSSVLSNRKSLNQIPELDFENRYGDVFINPEFPSEYNTITFNFSAIDFENPTLVKFSYKLDGWDSKFSPFQNVYSVTYPSLPPGKYTFYLKAKDRNGKVTDYTLEYPFIIKTPFFQSKIFFTIVTLFLFALLAWLYKIQIIDVRKKNKTLQKLYDERSKYANLLKQSEEDYKRLFEYAQDAILVVDINDLKIFDANQSALELYKYSKDELLGKDIKTLAIDNERAALNIEYIKKERAVRNLETVHRDSKGKLIEVSINATVMHYKQKETIVASIRDISREKEIQQNLIIAKEKAEKSDNLKSEFLAQMSHEIRTPINIIMNSIGLIEGYVTEKNEETEFAFGAVRRASDRIIRTIDLILNMSDIQQGSYEPNFEEVDLKNDVVQSLYYEYFQKAKDKGLEINFNACDEELKVVADDYTVTQIFANLIDNAIKYTDEGHVTINCIRTSENAIVEIVDTGIGIKKEYIPFIFDPFSQEDGGYSRKFDGNGLGMALVKKYCELNDAKIEIESEKGKGSVFRVIFKNPS